VQAFHIPSSASTADEPPSAAPRKRPFRFAVLAVSVLLIELALRLTPEGQEHWIYVLHRLYYLPIISAGLSFSWYGGFIAATVCSLSYLAHSQNGDFPDARNPLDRYLETVVFCLVGVLAGVLSDRERRQRTKAEQAAGELRRVYQELQDNVEHVKRAARMSALGHLSAGLAHEIRNPLASIEGAAAIVQREPENISRRTEFLEIIQDESRRLNRLVTNFLDFARPRRPELQLTDIGALLDSVISLVSQTTTRNDIFFDKQIPAQLSSLRCDSEQLKQVILNLLLNAVQAMPESGKILISAEEKENYLYIRIKDEGSGIPEESVESIYDPFFTTKQTGTGLGLPVAYQIVQQHGGELTLEENGPAGACFVIAIPYQYQEKQSNE
jgi:two-component system, NtrC family, sensor histidine kinase HydH